MFGFSVPMMVDLDIQNINSESPRIEDSQLVEDTPPISIQDIYTLPDNSCRYINYKSDNIEQQAKECLDVDIPAIPAI